MPKEATLQQIEEAFTYSPTITSEQAKHIIDELMTLRKELMNQIKMFEE